MQLELPKRLNSILPILKWNLTFYFRIIKKNKKVSKNTCNGLADLLVLIGTV